MKPINAITILLFVASAACESPKSEEDSVKLADEKNEEAFDNTPKEFDARFITDAVAASYAEIALANLALLNSSDSALQRKVRLMESDHTRILGELRVYASTHRITIPAEESKEVKTEVQMLTDSKAEDFDAKLCAKLRDYLWEEIRRFEICMSRTEDVELKNWIAITLPILNEHLKVIKEHPIARN